MKMNWLRIETAKFPYPEFNPTTICMADMNHDNVKGLNLKCSMSGFRSFDAHGEYRQFKTADASQILVWGGVKDQA
jgi:hypothetical protein